MYAQKKSKADTVKKDFWPSGLRIGTDVVSLIRSQTDESFTGYEVNADVDFYRYYLTADVGRWERTLISDEDLYTNNGNYYRAGIDINFLTKDPDKNMFFFGMRYGRSKYSENLTITVIDPVWGSNTNSYSNNNLQASWGELTTGLRVKMWKFFWMGYTARYKFGLNTNAPNDFMSTDVPGYGKTANGSTWGFNYQILFRIPFRNPDKAKAKLLNKKSEKG